MRLMLVDDEELSRRAIRVTLDREMPSVEIVAEAADGVEAIELAGEHQPDLIIMDIKMPELNGIEAADALRKKGDLARIVFLSAYDEFEYARGAIGVHADAYLLKPVDTAELLRVLAECETRLRAPEYARHLPRRPRVTDEQQRTGADSQAVGSWRLQRAIEHIDANLGQDLFLDDVAAEVGIGPQHLSRLFRTELDDSFTRFVNQRRIDHARHLLVATPLNVSEIADRVGFRDANYFGKVFRRMTDTTPSEFRRGGTH